MKNLVKNIILICSYILLLFFAPKNGLAGNMVFHKIVNDTTNLGLAEVTSMSISKIAISINPQSVINSKETITFEMVNRKNQNAIYQLDKEGTVLAINKRNKAKKQRAFPKMIAFNNHNFFVANMGDKGSELYKMDNAGNVSLVKDINIGQKGSYPERFIIFDNELYFTADGGNKIGKELYRVDKLSHVHLVKDINIGAADGYPTQFTIYNNALYFFAHGGAAIGRELFKVENGEVSLVTDINKGSLNAFSFNADVTVYNERLFFRADGGKNIGVELFCMNTNEEVSLVSNINSGSGNSYPSQFIILKDDFYFVAKDSNSWNLYSLDR